MSSLYEQFDDFYDHLIILVTCEFETEGIFYLFQSDILHFTILVKCKHVHYSFQRNETIHYPPIVHSSFFGRLLLPFLLFGTFASFLFLLCLLFLPTVFVFLLKQSLWRMNCFMGLWVIFTTSSLNQRFFTLNIYLMSFKIEYCVGKTFLPLPSK